MNIYLIAGAVAFIVIVVGIVFIVAIKSRGIENPPKSDELANQQGAAVGSGIAIGMGIGVALGVALDNLGVGIAIGVAIGAAVGTSMQRKNGGNLPVSNQEPRWVWGILAAVILLLVGGVIFFMVVN